MTYDAMRAMAKKPDNTFEPGSVICVDLICYAKLTTITNRTSIGKTQNSHNIKKLVELGWIIPMDKVRWRAGRWANNKFIVLDHADYERRAFKHEEPYAMCPPFKFNEPTGKKLTTITDTERRKFERSDFAINAVLKRHSESPEWRARVAALQAIMDAATPEERRAWFRPAKDED